MRPSHFLALSSLALLAGCSTSSYQGLSASADLAAAAGQKSRGKVNFSLHRQATVKVSGQVSGLKPYGFYQLLITPGPSCHTTANSDQLLSSLAVSHSAARWPLLRANVYGMAMVQFETKNMPLSVVKPSILNQQVRIMTALLDPDAANPVMLHEWACGSIERK